MESHYDVIVLGTGGVGSAALFHLATRGMRVAGLDRFPPAHDRGSSHGQSRIIRKAYFEHPDYVPLLRRAYELWEEMESRHGGGILFHRTGLLQIGPADGIVVPGVLKSAAQHGLDVRPMSAAEAEKTFPQYRVPPGYAAVFEKDAGLLRVEDCVRAHLDQAVMAGAELHTGIVVHEWHADAAGAEVWTNAGLLKAEHLVVTAGPWAPAMLDDGGVEFRVLRKPMFWLRARNPTHRIDAGCPCFFYELPDGQFYGFPELHAGEGIKVAKHTGGDQVADPAFVDRSLDESDLARVRAFSSDWLPEVSGELASHSTCLYTMSPDEHFVVDCHPKYPHVVFAAGLSGHGFKFTSVLGEILADLTCHGATKLPAGFLGLGRFGALPAA